MITAKQIRDALEGVPDDMEIGISIDVSPADYDEDNVGNRAFATEFHATQESCNRLGGMVRWDLLFDGCINF